MKRIPILSLEFLLLSAIPCISGPPSPRASESTAYRHAYNLFLVGQPTGCEDCYVPLLITAEPLEQVAKAKGQQPAILIITYERDSIWHDDGTLSFAPGDVEAAPRIIHLRGRKYRYQEITSSEVLKLLENPMGTIPISRPFVANTGPTGPTLEDLILAFRDPK